jgi:molybdopterin converting factor small subunit
MPRVTVELPSVLAQVCGGQRSLDLDATTLAGALERLSVEHPVLRVHLFGEDLALRQHVLCFHNGTNTRWLDTLEQPLADGDTITILQAVSGG